MMGPRGRLATFGIGAMGLAAVLVAAARDLPAVGAGGSVTGDVVSAAALPERRVTDAVAAVTFDYRGFDTLGEEFILLASVLGTSLLLRDEKGKRKTRDEGVKTGRPPPPSDAIRAMALALVGAMVILGLYVVVHGHQTPGGGFQGGVLLATAPLLAYLATGPDMLAKIAPLWLVELTEGLAVAGYVAIGLLGLLRGGSFMQNTLPLGTPGQLLSAGTIPILNVVTGAAVAGGLLLLLSRFLEKAREAGGGGRAQ